MVVNEVNCSNYIISRRSLFFVLCPLSFVLCPLFFSLCSLSFVLCSCWPGCTGVRRWWMRVIVQITWFVSSWSSQRSCCAHQKIYLFLFTRDDCNVTMFFTKKIDPCWWVSLCLYGWSLVGSWQLFPKLLTSQMCPMSGDRKAVPRASCPGRWCPSHPVWGERFFDLVANQSFHRVAKSDLNSTDAYFVTKN